MRPEVVLPPLLQRGPHIEILQLRESHERGCDEHVDAKDLLEAVVVQEEGILQRQGTVFVRLHHARVLHHVDFVGGPAGHDVGYHCLLQQSPVAREANEERGWPLGFVGGFVPGGDGREVGGRFCACGEGEIVFDFWRLFGWGFVKGFWFGFRVVAGGLAGQFMGKLVVDVVGEGAGAEG